MELNAHAYAVQGGAEVLESALALLKKEGIETVGNPDLFARAYASFSIDDARALREKAALRAVGRQGRIFIVAAPTIAADAQNALLKTFEEPPAGAKFFLIVPSPETLLPTLRSRMQTLTLERSDLSKIGKIRPLQSVDVKKFLATAPDKRLDLLKPFLEKGEEDKRDLAGTITFLTELERILGNKPKENAAGLHGVYRARKYITDRGALVKPLLEQLALLLPKML